MSNAWILWSGSPLSEVKKTQLKALLKCVSIHSPAIFTNKEPNECDLVLSPADLAGETVEKVVDNLHRKIKSDLRKRKTFRESDLDCFARDKKAIEEYERVYGHDPSVPGMPLQPKKPGFKINGRLEI